MLVLGGRRDRLFLTSPHLRLVASRSSGFVNGLDRCSLIAIMKAPSPQPHTGSHGSSMCLFSMEVSSCHAAMEASPRARQDN
nr:uncharacterized protein LOC109737282 [Aegilops tauschii subsp. strangulata]